jgi:hypothetical protein
MDTSLPQNRNIIRKMQAESVQSRILEAFLESAPQFILQWSIIFRTGNIGKIFIFSSLILNQCFFFMVQTRVGALNLNSTVNEALPANKNVANKQIFNILPPTVSLD